jgi:hypothetical protein
LSTDSPVIPINNVARIVRCNVGNEANAIAVDAYLRAAKGAFSSEGGYVQTIREVCKQEWAYEAQIVYKDVASFEAHAASDSLESFLDGLKPYIEEDSLYVGARVFDEWTPARKSKPAHYVNVLNGPKVGVALVDPEEAFLTWARCEMEASAERAKPPPPRKQYYGLSGNYISHVNATGSWTVSEINPDNIPWDPMYKERLQREKEAKEELARQKKERALAAARAAEEARQQAIEEAARSKAAAEAAELERLEQERLATEKEEARVQEEERKKDEERQAKAAAEDMRDREAPPSGETGYSAAAMLAMASVTIGVGFFIGQLFPSSIPLPGREQSSSAPGNTPNPSDTPTVSSSTAVQSDPTRAVQVGVVTALPPPPSAEAVASASTVTSTSAQLAQVQIDALIESQSKTDSENTVDEPLVVQLPPSPADLSADGTTVEADNVHGDNSPNTTTENLSTEAGSGEDTATENLPTDGTTAEADSVEGGNSQDTATEMIPHTVDVDATDIEQELTPEPIIVLQNGYEVCLVPQAPQEEQLDVLQPDSIAELAASVESKELAQEQKPAPAPKSNVRRGMSIVVAISAVLAFAIQFK